MPPPIDDVSLVVFARAPVPGRVKTRLVGPCALSPEAAARLHGAFVRDVCRAGARAGLGRRRLYVAGGAGEAGALAEIAAAEGFSLRNQAEGDLGARMAQALSAELAAGAAAVVLVGSDSPTLPPALLREGAEALRGEADLILGPAADGGYWLVGARRPCDELFAPPMAWSTPDVLPETLERLARLQAAGRAVRLLPFHYDVDTPAELRLLRAELRLRPEAAPATRAILDELGLL